MLQVAATDRLCRYPANDSSRGLHREPPFCGGSLSLRQWLGNSTQPKVPNILNPIDTFKTWYTQLIRLYETRILGETKGLRRKLQFVPKEEAAMRTAAQAFRDEWVRPLQPNWLQSHPKEVNRAARLFAEVMATLMQIRIKQLPLQPQEIQLFQILDQLRDAPHPKHLQNLTILLLGSAIPAKAQES